MGAVQQGLIIVFENEAKNEEGVVYNGGSPDAEMRLQLLSGRHQKQGEGFVAVARGVGTKSWVFVKDDMDF